MRRVHFAALAAIALLLGSTDLSPAQSKKQPRTGTSTFQQCCEKAYARFEIRDRTGHCFTQGDQQQDALYQCVHQNGLRTKTGGQQSG